MVAHTSHEVAPSCLMQLYVRRGSEVFRDDVLWNVNNPCNTSYAYAARVRAASVNPSVNIRMPD